MTRGARLAVVGPPGADLASTTSALGVVVDTRAETGSLRFLEQRLGATTEAPPPSSALVDVPGAEAFHRGASRVDGPLVGTAIGLILPLWERAVGELDVHIVIPAPETTATALSHRPPAAAARCWVDHVLHVLSTASSPTWHLSPSPGRRHDDPWSRLANDLHAGLLQENGLGLDLHEMEARAKALLPTSPTSILVVAARPPVLPRPVRPGAVSVRAGLTAREAYDLAAQGWRPVSPAALAAVRVERPELAVALDGPSLADTTLAVSSYAPLTPIGAPSALAAEGHVDLVVDPAHLNRPVDDLLTTAPTAPGSLRAPRVRDTPMQRGVTSVVIPVHGHPSLTLACLDALERSTARPLQVVVVDDASPDNSLEQIADHPRIDRLVALSTNRGFAGATNAGLDEATGEFVCILNNDTEPTAGWLEALLDALAVPGTGISGPRTNRISGRQCIEGAPGFDTAEPATLHDWAARWTRERAPVTWRVPRLVGFCLLTRRSLLLELGSLDEGVGRGNYEDDEFCGRVRRAGMTCRVADNSVVLHHGSATFRHLQVDHGAAMLAGARHTNGRLLIDDDLIAATIDGTTSCLDDVVRSIESVLPLTSTVTVKGTDPATLYSRLGAVSASVRTDGSPDVAADLHLDVHAGQVLPRLDVALVRAALEGRTGVVSVADILELAPEGGTQIHA